MDAAPASLPDDTDARERALLARLVQGDSEAFAALVDRHLNRVTKFAVYLTGSDDMAEDIAQAVFIQLWERRATVDPNRPLRPYLLRAAHNRVIDEQRAGAVRQKYHEYVRASAIAGSIRAAVPSPESGILATATVHEAIRHLSERRQLALRLWFEEEMTAAEIADTLSISPTAADRLVRRALAELRQILLVST